MKDVLEPFSDIGAPATACWCACFNFEDSSRPCDEHKAALVAEVRRLRAELDDVTTDNLLAEACCSCCYRVNAERTEAARVREALQAAERKVRAVELLHVWTNEDGKRFVFADDLAVALEVPGALDAALGGAE